MIPELRAPFNAAWRPQQYADLLDRIEKRAGAAVGFRISETPVFLPEPLLNTIARYGHELFAQIAHNPAYHAASLEAIPPQYRVPDEPDHPLFVQADFGLIRGTDGSLEPRLVEIQGFPSIYALQFVMAQEYRASYGLPSNLRSLCGDLTEEGYLALLRRAILGSHSPEHVVLLEIDPYRQKTAPDFLITRDLLGLRIADISHVEKRGRKLYFDGVEIRRIYNRVVVDELARKQVPSQFAFTDDMDVEWAGHPNWFFHLSKFSLPWFDHPCVPETSFLKALERWPEDLEEYVLKPLYSFAGLGVQIGPSREELDAIPLAARGDYILQRKMDFVPVIETPVGPTKVEIRVMYIWDKELVPVTTVLRTGRGKMMGVDFNKDMTWTGASAGFYLPE